MNVSVKMFLFSGLFLLAQVAYSEGEDVDLSKKTHQAIYGESLINPYPVLWLREGPDIIKYFIPDDYRTSMIGLGWAMKSLGYHTPVSLGGAEGVILKTADLNFAYGFNGMTHSKAMGRQTYEANVERNYENFFNQNGFFDLEIVEGLSVSLAESIFFDANSLNDHSVWNLGVDYNTFKNPNLPSQGFSVGAAYSVYVQSKHPTSQVGYGASWYQELENDNLVLFAKTYGQNTLGQTNADFAIMNKGPWIFNNSPLNVEAARGEQNLGDFGFKVELGLRIMLGSVEGVFDWGKGIIGMAPSETVDYRAYNHVLLEPEIFVSQLYYTGAELSTEYGFLFNVELVNYQDAYSSKPMKGGIGFALSDRSDKAKLLLSLSL